MLYWYCNVFEIPLFSKICLFVPCVFVIINMNNISKFINIDFHNDEAIQVDNETRFQFS